jgi:hypothetical protein
MVEALTVTVTLVVTAFHQESVKVFDVDAVGMRGITIINDTIRIGHGVKDGT